MNSKVYRLRLIHHRAGMAFSIIAMGIGLAVLLWILATLIINGYGAFSASMFYESTPAPGSHGGLSNAILGSFLIVTLSTIFSTPIGILAGIYLTEYGETSRFAKITRFVTDIMLSAPSIVIGLFVYAVYVARIGHFSGYAGSAALALIAIPVVVRTTDNMLQLVPNSLLEAAYALGAPRWKVAIIVRFRAVRAGVITGVLLALARVAGETAPLLFTALNNQFMSYNMNAPIANLPYVINQFAMSPYDNWRTLAWGGASLVTLVVLALNIIARSLFSKKN